jgi:hypothetical protein
VAAHASKLHQANPNTRLLSQVVRIDYRFVAVLVAGIHIFTCICIYDIKAKIAEGTRLGTMYRNYSRIAVVQVRVRSSISHRHAVYLLVKTI